MAGSGPVLVISVDRPRRSPCSRRSRTDLILAVFVLVYLVDLLTIRAHFDRYVLPLVPPLAVLAGRQRALAPLTLGLLIVPLVWAIGDDVRLTRTDTRVVAQRWIVAHLPRGRDGRRRLLDAAARSAAASLDARSCPAPAGRTTQTGTWPGCEAEGVRLRARHRRDRRPRPRRARPLPAGGALLRRPANPGETGLPCSGGARADRALGLPLPPMRKTLLLLPLARAGARRRLERAHARTRRRCPKAWAGGWQKLANKIHAPVYCPGWLPDPLTGQIGGRWNNINSVSKDRSYLIGFVWQEIGRGDPHQPARLPGRDEGARPAATSSSSAARST